MKVFYNAEIQMLDGFKPDAFVMEPASSLMNFLKKDVDELDDTHASILFDNHIMPTEMKSRVRNLLTTCPTIHYVDVMYRFEFENVPDRFVIWSDGKSQDYTGHIVFTED